MFKTWVWEMICCIYVYDSLWRADVRTHTHAHMRAYVRRAIKYLHACFSTGDLGSQSFQFSEVFKRITKLIIYD